MSKVDLVSEGDPLPSELVRRLQALADVALERFADEGLLQALAEAVREALEAENACILLTASSGEWARVGASVGRPHQAVGREVRVLGTVCDRILASDRPIVVEWPPEGRAGSVLGARLAVAGKLIGLLEVGATRPGQFDERDVQLMAMAAGRVALAIENARLLESERRVRTAAERAAERMARLRDFATARGDARTVAEMAQVILDHVVPAVGASGGMVVMLRDERAAEILASVGFPQPLIHRLHRFPIDAGTPVAHAMRNQAPVFIPDLTTERMSFPALAPLAEATGYGAWAALALIVRGQLLGGLGLGFRAPHNFDTEEQAFILNLGEQSALGLDHAQAQESAHLVEQEKEEFLAAVAHDIKNPLAAVKGFLQLTERQAVRKETVESPWLLRRLNTMHDSVNQMLTLVEQLLDITWLGMGRQLELVTAPTELVALARRVVQQQQATTQRHRIHLDAPTERMMGQWDARRLERVLHNLLGNAVKYSPRGGRVWVKLEREEGAGGDWAVVSVQDEGIGIPEAELGRIFERFYRAANARGVKGTGIGLASVRHVVEEHGGTIAVQSCEGQGSCFTIRLPLGLRMSADKVGQ